MTLTNSTNIHFEPWGAGESEPGEAGRGSGEGGGGGEVELVGEF